MQSKNMNYLVIIIIAIFVVGLLYWQTLPARKPVSNVVVFEADILDSSVVKEIKGRKSYGNLPVMINAGEAGKQDPFTGP